MIDTPSHPDVSEIVFDDGGMNLLSRSNLDRLHARFETARHADVVIFRSGRPGLFAAGADMNEMVRFSPFDAWNFARAGQELMEAIERHPALTIAIVDGDCFGGALDLLMAFDLRIATPASRFAHPGARLGIVTGFGGTTRWRRIARPGAVSRLFLENEVLEPEAALRSGLITAITDGPGALAREEIEVWIERSRALRWCGSRPPGPRRLDVLMRLAGQDG